MLEFLGICFVLHVVLRAWRISRLRRENEKYERGEGPCRRSGEGGEAWMAQIFNSHSRDHQRKSR